MKMIWFFSDRYRLQKLTIALLLLFGLGVYANIMGSQQILERGLILEKCLEDPISCVEKPLVMHVQINLSSDNLYIAYPNVWGAYQLKHPVTLAGKLKGLKHGQIISILGAYSHDSVFIITDYQESDWIRTLKYGVSLLGLLFTIILFIRRYRFSPDRLFPLVHR